MSTLNVKVPHKMDKDIEAFLEAHPHYLNESELVRDALRHVMETPRLSDRTVEDELDSTARERIETELREALDGPDLVLSSDEPPVTDSISHCFAQPHHVPLLRRATTHPVRSRHPSVRPHARSCGRRSVR